MTDRKRMINELTFQLNSKDVKEYHYAIQLSVTDAEKILTLLEAQEPRVLTLDEVKASKGTDMYLEISARPVDVPYITAATLDGVGVKGVTFYHSSFAFLTYNRRYYGWRCWTSRPTEEQRKKVKWNAEPD